MQSGSLSSFRTDYLLAGAATLTVVRSIAMISHPTEPQYNKPIKGVHHPIQPLINALDDALTCVEHYFGQIITGIALGALYHLSVAIATLISPP